MTVAELAKELAKMPQDSEMYVATECHGCFEPANHIRVYKHEPGIVVIDSGTPAAATEEDDVEYPPLRGDDE